MKYSQFKRVVIKIGSNILTDEYNKLDLNNLRHLVEQISVIHARGIEIVVVTSGAIVCGSEKLGIVPKTIPDKQAAAAIGQSLLMNEYNTFFQRAGITIGQLLLTHDVVSDKGRRQNVENTLNTLLRKKVIPIINENDSVVVDEIKFGDNDALSAHVVELVKAQALIILTDIEGLYSADPRTNKNAVLLDEVKITPQILAACGGSGSKKGTGGMYSKVISASKALAIGTEVIIANGRKLDVLLDIFSGKKIGTRFVM